MTSKEYFGPETDLSAVQFFLDSSGEKFRLGKGSFGEVYKAQISDKIVAIKPFETEHNLNYESAKLLLFQLCGLRDDNIAALYSMILQNNGLYGLAVEYVDNGTLLQLIEKYRIPVCMKVKMLYDLSALLARLHTSLACMWHTAGTPKALLNVTANNVLLDSNCTVKLRNVGMAQVETLLYGEGMMYFTPTHSAPELLKGGELGEWTDVWSFGVLVFELFAENAEPYNRIPFPNEYNESQMMYTIKENPNTILSQSQLSKLKECPDMLTQYIHKCMKAKHTERPPFTEISQRLKNEFDNNHKTSYPEAIKDIKKYKYKASDRKSYHRMSGKTISSLPHNHVNSPHNTDTSSHERTPHEPTPRVLTPQATQNHTPHAHYEPTEKQLRLDLQEHEELKFSIQEQQVCEEPMYTEQSAVEPQFQIEDFHVSRPPQNMPKYNIEERQAPGSGTAPQNMPQNQMEERPPTDFQLKHPLLHRVQSFLLENMETDQVMDYLIQEDLIKGEDVDLFFNLDTRLSRVKFILSRIDKAGDVGIRKLAEGLRSSQSFIVEHLSQMRYLMYQEKIRQKREYLIDNLRPDDVSVLMFSRNMIDLYEFEHLQNEENSFQKSKLIVDLILIKPAKLSRMFVKLLGETNQGFLADQLKIY